MFFVNSLRQGRPMARSRFRPFCKRGTMRCGVWVIMALEPLDRLSPYSPGHTVSRMRRRVLLATLTAGVLAGVSAYMLTCTFFSAWVFGYGQGDAGYAQKW